MITRDRQALCNVLWTKDNPHAPHVQTLPVLACSKAASRCPAIRNLTTMKPANIQAYEQGVKFSEEWDILHTENQWSNEETMKRYNQKIVVAFISKKRKDPGLAGTHPALALYDGFSTSVC